MGADKILRSHSAEILGRFVVAQRPRYVQGIIRLANADSWRLAWTPPGDCFSFETWMSKRLLNDPFALFSNKALVQGAPFDAGSLGHFL
jgi:hypothetical protein